MFWGVKLECGKQYSQLVERSFHISHAVFQPENVFLPGRGDNNIVEVHAVVEKTDYLLCYLDIQIVGSSLNLHMIQQPLNLNVSEGEEITLYARKLGLKNEEQQAAAGSVYLTGYFVDEPTFEPNLEDLLRGDVSEELSSADEYSLDADEGRGSGHNGQSLATLLLEGSLVDSDSEGDADFMADDILVEGNSGISTRKRLAKPVVVEEIKEDDKDGPGHNSAPPSKRQRSSNVEDYASPNDTRSAKMKKSTKKKKKKKKEGNSDNKAADTTINIADNASSPKEKKLASFRTPGGTEVQELEMGSGKIAKPGAKVFMKYTGRLAHNNKIFDSNITQRKPFMFRLGQGEVVKGWDEGVKGMKVGGKRRLLIPPKQGYGASGAPPHVPPNSKLLFDIELVDVK